MLELGLGSELEANHEFASLCPRGLARALHQGWARVLGVEGFFRVWGSGLGLQLGLRFGKGLGFRFGV